MKYTIALYIAFLAAGCESAALRSTTNKTVSITDRTMPITNTTINHGHDQAKKRKAAGTRTGDMTYYTVGMGACGHDDSGKGDSEYIVAVSESLDTDSCGQTVTIQGSNGNSVQGVVRDKCPSCAEGALDVSEKTFKDLIGDLDVGVAQVTWSFN